METSVLTEKRCLLTVAETAKRLGIAPRTIYNGLGRRAKKPFPIKPKHWGRKVLFDSLDVNSFIENLPYVDEGTLDHQSNG